MVKFDAYIGLSNINIPILGKPYTVREITNYGSPGLRLNEVKNKEIYVNQQESVEPCFMQAGFIPFPERIQGFAEICWGGHAN